MPGTIRTLPYEMGRPLLAGRDLSGQSTISAGKNNRKERYTHG